MFRNLLYVLFIFLISFSTFSQNRIELGYGYKHPINTEKVLYADHVKVRAKPNTKSKALVTLSIGTPLTILEFSKDSLEFNGIKSPWVKIQTDEHTGYVLSDFIAAHSIVKDGRLFLVKLHQKNRNTLYSIRAYENGYVQAEITDTLNSRFEFIVEDNKGLTNIKNVIYLSWIGEACGVDGGYDVLFYYPDNVHHIKYITHCSSMGDGGIYGITEDLIFPNDEGGMADLLIFKSIEQENEDTWMVDGKYTDNNQPLYWMKRVETESHHRFFPGNGSIEPEIKKENRMW